MTSHRTYNPWIVEEGDRWYERNKAKLESGFDPVVHLLREYKIVPRRVCEVGCSNGYRLAALHLEYNCEVVGVEPSAAAISDGAARWPFIRFIRATGDDFSIGQPADLVIVHFVLHWVLRPLLFATMERIDAALAAGGYLVIGDFGVEGFLKRKYHHRPQDDLWTYKQYYPAMFTATGLYREIGMIRIDHDTHLPSAHVTTDTLGTVTLLRKQELYVEQNG